MAIPGIALTIGLAFIARFGSSEIAAHWMNGAASPISPVLLGIASGMLWRHFIGLSSNAEQGVQWVLGHDPAHRHRAGRVAFDCRRTGGSWPSGIRRRCIMRHDRAPPWLAAMLLHEQPRLVGIFLGSAIHDTSQVVGASLIYAQQFGSPDVAGFASATQLFRNLSIILLVPLLAWSTRSQPTGDLQPAQRRKALVPHFVIWFVGLVLVRTLGDQLITGDTQTQRVWLQILGTSQSVSDLCMTWAMTAVGLSVSLTQMHRVGSRPICAALIIAAAIAACGLAVTRILLS